MERDFRDDGEYGRFPFEDGMEKEAGSRKAELCVMLASGFWLPASGF
jgi:hypothetical protein